MRWSQPLEEIIGSRAKIRALRSLYRADGAMSAREVSRATGLSHTGALRALEELREQDVVALSPGTRLGYILNRAHVLIASGIAPLLELEGRLDEVLADFVCGLVPRAVSVTIFGSAARREDGPRSDLDLLVVVPDGCDTSGAFDALAGADAMTRFGKSIRPVVWTASDLRSHIRGGTRLAQSILRDGRVISGMSPLAIVHGAGRAKRAAG